MVWCHLKSAIVCSTLPGGGGGLWKISRYAPDPEHIPRVPRNLEPKYEILKIWNIVFVSKINIAYF